jgi:hypothetical protein
MADRLIHELIPKLPNEAVMVIRSGSGEVISHSEEISKLFDEFTRETVLLNATKCTDTVSVTLDAIKSGVREKFLGTDKTKLTFHSKPVPWDESLRLVTIDREPSYEQLQEQYGLITYTAETLDRGVGLMCLDLGAAKRTWFDYVSNRFSELIGNSVEELKTFGYPTFLNRIHPDDMKRVETQIESTELREWECPFRLLFDDEYVWRRFICNTLAGDEINGVKSVQLAMILEDFTEGNVELERRENEPDKSSCFMLSSFISAVFDSSFYVDDNFQIVDDSRTLRFFLNGDPDTSIKGISLESLVESEEDRQRFREYLVKPLQSQASTANPEESLPAAPMIRLPMILGEHRIPTDVQIYACPTYLNAIEGLDSMTVPQSVPFLVVGNATLSSGSNYLIGIRVVTQTSDPTINEYPEYAPPVITFDDSGNESDRGSVTSASRRRVRTGPLLSGVPEDSETESDASFESVFGGGRSPIRRPYSAGMMSHALQRFLTRDILHSIEGIDMYDKSVPSEHVSCPSTTWLTPQFDLSDFMVMEEEVIRSLPNTCQAEFLKASREMNFQLCGELLSQSVEGNANILQPFDLIENSDFVHCIFRFFLGIALSAPIETSYRLLKTLHDSFKRVSKSIGRVGTEIARFEYTFTLLTVALRYPEWFSTSSSMQWLRESFGEAMKAPKSKQIDKSRRLPSMYFLCVLWASLMHLLGRMDEAKALLENLFEDMFNYCKRHPESTGVRNLQAITAHNLAVTELENGELYRTLHWVHNLQQLVQVSHSSFPKRCQELVTWAQATQAAVEKQQVKGM